MNEGSVARRYAKALMALGQEDGLVDQLGRELAVFQAVTAVNDGALMEVLSNPVYTLHERQRVVGEILPKLGLHAYTNNFLRLLVDKSRMAILADILREYNQLADDAAGRVRGVVTATFELPQQWKDSIAKALSQATGRTVVLTTRVDNTLLGGLIAQVGSRVFDASLRTRLENLQLSLTTTPEA